VSLSLRSFHLFFITVSVALSALVVVWGVRSWRTTGSSGDLAFGAMFLLVGIEITTINLWAMAWLGAGAIGAVLVGRATIYRSDISHMLRPGGVFLTRDARANGVELEWSQSLGSQLKASANVSHTNTFDPRANGPNVVSADWLGNATLLYHAAHNVIFAGRFNYIGSRRAGSGYDGLDLTLTQQDAFVRGLALRVGVKDLLNGQPSYFALLPTGNIVTSRYPGRSAWVEVSWKP